MSNHLAIATVTAVLGEAIISPAVRSAVSGTEITTRRPDDPTNANGGPRVNVYLYRVLPNAAWRNADLPTRRHDSTLVQQPQAALDLHYLLTFYGEEAQLVPQRLLASSVTALHARPVLTREAIRRLVQNAQDSSDTYHFLATSDLAEQVELVKFAPLSLNLEELSKLWSVFFQTPYTLSVAYQASVVLIEGEETPQTALPVRERNLYVVPFRQPVIEQVLAEEGANEPILASSTLIIRGQRLRGDITRVLIAGEEVTPPSEDVSDTQIELQLSSLPLGSLRAGVQGVLVVHPMLMGTPPVPHRGVESNVAAFVLHPTIPKDTDGNYEITVSTSAKVTVKVSPEVGMEQRVVLLLNEFAAPWERPARAYSFKAQPIDEDTDSIDFPISGVKPGDYLVRVQVDGAQSPLEMDAGGRYSAPKVTIP